jgi:UDP-N-acetylmuramate dehydrogenase
VGRGYAGIENLSLIPSSVGACPVQNIGAYGAEVSETITRVKAVDLKSGEMKGFQ